MEGDEGEMIFNRHIEISIHALRVEGDNSRNDTLVSRYISIHALRVEGDASMILTE